MGSCDSETGDILPFRTPIAITFVLRAQNPASSVILTAASTLKESHDYELYQITEQKVEVFKRVIKQQVEATSEELMELQSQAERLEQEIAGPSGVDAISL